MSKNTVDAAIRMSNIGLIPFRRQVDFDGGYVGWTTQELADYVATWRPDIHIERDHGGEGQGSSDYLKSFSADAQSFSIIHVDPWKVASSLKDGTEKTIEYILYIFKQNPDIYFEVGTEESIFPFTLWDYSYLLSRLSDELNPQIFARIKYCVVQSGVSIDLTTQTNSSNNIRQDYDDQIKTIHFYNIKTKEHNSDYLNRATIFARKYAGLDALNIAPEFGQIETKILMDHMNEEQKREFLAIILEHDDRWKKWTPEGWEGSVDQLMLTGGHYVLNEDKFKELKKELPEKIDDLITRQIIIKMSIICNQIVKF